MFINLLLLIYSTSNYLVKKVMLKVSLRCLAEHLVHARLRFPPNHRFFYEHGKFAAHNALVDLRLYYELLLRKLC